MRRPPPARHVNDIFSHHFVPHEAVLFYCDEDYFRSQGWREWLLWLLKRREVVIVCIDLSIDFAKHQIAFGYALFFFF